MILLLTAGFGDGHNTAARNVARALESLAPAEPVRVVDVIELAHPVFSPVLQWGYRLLITRTPILWKAMYHGSAKMKFERGPYDMVALVRSAMLDLIRSERPRAIISTYPLYPRLLQQLRDEGETIPQWFTVVTDSITIHPVWTLADSAAFCVADDETAKALVEQQIPPAHIRVTGFPVSLDFQALGTPPPPRAPGGRVLYMPSTGVGHVHDTLEALRPLVSGGMNLTLVLGKHHQRLYQTVRRFTDSLPHAAVDVLAWTQQMPQLLRSHDLVICKAGGAILHEALAAGCPAVIDYIVPGQEEGNAQFLVAHGCGFASRSPASTADIVTRMLADGGAEARRMREKALAAGVPRAALNIAEAVLREL